MTINGPRRCKYCGRPITEEEIKAKQVQIIHDPDGDEYFHDRPGWRCVDKQLKKEQQEAIGRLLAFRRQSHAPGS